MSVGDITSNERGTGARFNDGKLDVLQIPVFIYSMILGSDSKPFPCLIDWISDFESRDGIDENILVQSFRCLGDPLEVLREAIGVFCYGEKKYARYNWMKGMKWSVPLACIVRHDLAIRGGQELDPESGLPHRGHIACNLIMLLYYINHYTEGDDRRGQVAVAPGPVIILDDSQVTSFMRGDSREFDPMIGDKVRVNLSFHRHHGKVGTVIGTSGGRDILSSLYVANSYNVEFDGGAQDKFGYKEIESASAG